MSAVDKRKNRAEYMRLWRASLPEERKDSIRARDRARYAQKVAAGGDNLDRLRRQKREAKERHIERQGIDAVRRSNSAYMRQRYLSMTPEERRATCNGQAIRRWQKANPDKVKAIRARYFARHPEAMQRWREARNIAMQNRRNAAGFDKIRRPEWRARLEEFGHRCAYCGTNAKGLSMDHVQALSRGGRHTISNVVPACKPCNSRKHANGVLAMVNTLYAEEAT